MEWKSLAKLSAIVFRPGDTVYFARGSKFNGGFRIGGSGEPGKPITFTVYGSGLAPRFSNPDFNLLNGNAIEVRGSYVVIDGLHFHDCATVPVTGTRGGVRKLGAIFVAVGANHNVIRNCDITRSPVGVKVYGQYTLVTHNFIHDNHQSITRGWGPMAIVICASNNEISYNHVTNYTALSPEWGGGDGGAVEIDDRTYPKANIYVHHNRSFGNQGFMETVGGADSVEDNIVLAYNVSDDYQWFAGCGNCTNFRVENNTVIRLLNNGSWNGVFRFDGSAPASVRNNIFVVGNGARVFEGRDNGLTLSKHDHNLYFSPGTLPVREPQGRGVALGQSELIADPRFVDFGNRDLRLADTSPAIHAGAILGHVPDFDDHPVSAEGAPDIGAFGRQTPPAKMRPGARGRE